MRHGEDVRDMYVGLGIMGQRWVREVRYDREQELWWEEKLYAIV